MAFAVAQYEVPVAEPYRLDLTVSVLRRLSTNLVDVLTPEGVYLRVIGMPIDRCWYAFLPSSGARSFVTLEGEHRGHRRALETVHRMLGTDRTLREFDRGAARIPWLRPLALRMRGVKPPRYPTLWEGLRERNRFPAGEYPRRQRHPATLRRHARFANRVE